MTQISGSADINQFSLSLQLQHLQYILPLLFLLLDSRTLISTFLPL